MEKQDKYFINEWPLSFNEIEHVEIENPFARVFYHSFFSLLNLPEKTGGTVITLCRKSAHFLLSA